MKPKKEKDQSALPTKASIAADIQNRIMSFRGRQVLLDRDLAMLYGVSTRALNQAVKRNANRFPEGFAFRLSKEENDSLKS